MLYQSLLCILRFFLKSPQRTVSYSFKIILIFVSKRIANILVKGHVCALKTFWSARFLFFRLSIASQLLLLRGARSCAATAYSAATRVQFVGAYGGGSAPWHTQ